MSAASLYLKSVYNNSEVNMDKFCFSCGDSLGMPQFKGPVLDYCKYCTDDKRNLKSREEVQKGIAGWFKS
jgi:hypothetical protein